MKKLIISLAILLVVIIAAILIIPYITGIVFEKNYLATVTSLNSSQKQLKMVNYNRGWFSSDAVIKANLTMPATMANKLNQPGTLQIEQVELTLNQHIQHGPIFYVNNINNNQQLLTGLAYVTSTIQNVKPVVVAVVTSTYSAKQAPANQLAENTATTQQQVFDAQNTPTLNIAGFKLTSHVQFNGNTNNCLQIDTASSTFPQVQANAIFKNITAKFLLSADLSNIKGNLNIANINITAPNLTQQLNTINVDVNASKLVTDLYVGTTTVKVNSIINADAKNNKIVLQNLTLNSNSQAQQNKMNYDLVINLANYQFDNASYGPNVLSLSFNNLDIPSLIALRNQFADLNTQPGITTPTTLAKYNRALLLLLSKGVAVDLKQLSIATPWGTPQLNASLTFPPQVQEIANPFTLMNSMQASVNMQLPVTFTSQLLTILNTWAQHQEPKSNQPLVSPEQKTQQQIEEWVKNNWLVMQGDHYNMNLVYKDKQILVNGKPITTPSPTNTLPVNN